MLHEDADDRNPEATTPHLHFRVQAVANALHRISHRPALTMLVSTADGNDRTRRKRFDRKTIQRAGAREPRSRNAIGSNIDGDRRVRLGVQPQRYLAHKMLL